MKNIYNRMDELIRNNQPAALCVVIATQGSTPRKAGAKMLVFKDGTIEGTIGGGSVEKKVTEIAVTLIGKELPEKHTFELEDDLQMHCGGYMEVYIEPINPLQKLIIFGAGHIGKVLSRYSRDFHFAVTVVDPRPGIFEDQAFESAACIEKDFLESIDQLVFDDQTYMVIVTPKHVSDEEILARVALKPHAYLGMIGSERKVALAKKRFLSEGILSEQVLNEIDMPVGIKFAAETPEEIAISILAKLIDVRNRRMKND